MNFRGRAIDPLAFWERYVELPTGTKVDPHDSFLPKVACPNPEHDTLKRHFQINAREPYVHCFAHCGISGSWEHAICVIEGLYDKFKVDVAVAKRAWNKSPSERSENDREQLRREQRARREARRIILRASSGKLSKFQGTSSVRKKHGSPRPVNVVPVDELRYESFLPPVALEYLESREITDSSVSRWKLGWLPDEKRIAIPAYDENDNLKFLIKRAVLAKQNPKYLYTEGFPKTHVLFGAGQIDLGMIKSHGLGLVEGSIDTIVMHQHGLRFFGGILGTGISEQQRRIVARFRPRRIYLWFDKDSAGVHNIEIAAQKLRKYPLYVVRYPKGKSDPAEVTEQEAWRQIERAVPISQFITKNGLSVKSYQRMERITVG